MGLWYTPALLMRKRFLTRIAPRDLEILSSLDRTPLTSEQLCRLSVTFGSPFRDQHNLRRRLRSLMQAGLLKSWPYAIATEGRSPRYFRLTRDGYRLLYGQDAPLPHRRTFEEISHGHHYHTFALAELIVHLVTAGHKQGIVMRHFARENSVCITAGNFTLRPDCAFQLARPDGAVFNLMVELDNGTERVRSRLDVESIERKLRGYDLHQSQFAADDPSRYLVLFVTTRSVGRLDRILTLACAVMHNPQRTVFLGCNLDQLRQVDPFRSAIFRDHRGLKRTLIPMLNPPTKNRAVSMTETVLA